jgi:hypothetical protein
MAFKRVGDGNGNGKGTPPENPKVTNLKVFQGGKKSQLTPEQMDTLKKELEEYKIVPPSLRSDKDPGFQRVAEALIRCDGFVMKTAIRLKISFSRLKKIIEKNPKLKSICLESTESLLDLAESKLRIAIAKGESWGIIFALKCKGRQRGWIETGESSAGEEKPVTFNYQTEVPEGYKLVMVKDEENKEVAN